MSASTAQGPAAAAGSGRWLLMCNTFETGGIERQFNILSRSLLAQKREVLLACLDRKGAFLEGVGDVVPFPTGGSFLSPTCFRNRWRLAALMRRNHVSVAHSFDFYSNLMLGITARFAGVPVVIACQNQLGDLLTPNQNRAEVANFRYVCDRVVCNSRAAADRLEKLGVPKKKLVLIPNGIIDEAFREATPVLPARPGWLRIGVVGRMNDPVKNQDGFLRAAAQVAAHHPSVEFVLAGDGPLRPALEKLAAELRISERVLFLGDRRDVPEVLASLDVAVVPSHSESLSNSILEAMAARRAVVATAVGGSPEVIHDGETGLLVPKRDDGALATAIDRFIMSAELRLRCGEQARRLALDYSLDRLRERHEALYAQVLAEKLGTNQQSLACDPRHV